MSGSMVAARIAGSSVASTAATPSTAMAPIYVRDIPRADLVEEAVEHPSPWPARRQVPERGRPRPVAVPAPRSDE